MAIHDSVLLGALSQSVDNLTMYVSQRLRIVRHKVKHVRNPRTDKQRAQRAKMKAVVDVASSFASVAKVGFPVQSAGQTGYNVFVSSNLQAVTVDEDFVATLDFTKLVCSADLKLRTPKVTASVTGNNITFAQESQVVSSQANRDDLVYAVVYEKLQDEVELVKLKVRSENGSTVFAMPEGWEVANVVAYTFAKNISGRRTSKTLVLSLENGG